MIFTLNSLTLVFMEKIIFHITGIFLHALYYDSRQSSIILDNMALNCFVRRVAAEPSLAHLSDSFDAKRLLPPPSLILKSFFLIFNSFSFSSPSSSSPSSSS